jgi:hypothetical protein
MHVDDRIALICGGRNDGWDALRIPSDAGSGKRRRQQRRKPSQHAITPANPNPNDLFISGSGGMS